MNFLPCAATYIRSGIECPVSNLTAREMALAALCNRRPTMSAQIIKASISFVTVAALAGSLFAISWIGLALLGFLGQFDFELSRLCASTGRKRSVEGKVDCVAVEAGAMKHCQH